MIVVEHIEYGNAILGDGIDVSNSIKRIFEEYRIPNSDSILEGLDLSTFRQKKGTSLTTILGKRLAPFISEKQKAELLKKIRELYPIEGQYKLTLYPPSKFDEIIIEDGGSCFRKGGCNRGHFEALVHLFASRRDVVPYYTLIEQKQNGTKTSTTRAWCWFYRNKKITIFQNFYGAYPMKLLRFPVACMAGKLMNLDIENIRLAIKTNKTMPIYTNGDELLIVYPSSYSSSEEAWEDFLQAEVECPLCHALVSIGELEYGDGIVGCTCFEDIGRCEDCGDRLHIDSLVYIESMDRYVCEACYTRQYESCSRCGDIFYKSDMLIISNEYYCGDCYENLFEEGEVGHCGGCGRVFWTESLSDGICRDCCSKFFVCSSCHSVLLPKHTYFVGNNPYCKECYYDDNFFAADSPIL